MYWRVRGCTARGIFHEHLNPFACCFSSDYPPHLLLWLQVGRMVLNRNPDNQFQENEMLAFCPAVIVPGEGCSTLVADECHCGKGA